MVEGKKPKMSLLVECSERDNRSMIGNHTFVYMYNKHLNSEVIRIVKGCQIWKIPLTMPVFKAYVYHS